MSRTEFAFVSVVLLSGAFCIASSHGQIRGRVADRTGAGLGSAFIRLTSEKGGPTLYRSRADVDGYFALENIGTGSYCVRIWKEGFREKALHNVIVQPSITTDLGPVLLELSGCDAPGVICDCFGSEAACKNSVVANGYLTLSQRCGADLDAGESICVEDSRTDLLFSPGEDTLLYLRLMNGALIGSLNSSAPNCDDAARTNDPVRLNGLGPGNDFWVRTTEGNCSHVFTIDDVEPDAVELKLWYVNRKR